MRRKQIQMSSPWKRHKTREATEAIGRALVSGSIPKLCIISLLSLLLVTSSIMLIEARSESVESDSEFVLFNSDLSNDNSNNNKQTPDNLQDGRFIRSKRRRYGQVVVTRDYGASLRANRLFAREGNALSQQQAASGNAIPAASPNFEAAFQGECNQNNETANSNPCEHICLDLHDGTYECSCFYGFTLAVDGYSCAKLPQAAPQLPQPPAEPASPPRATATQLSSSVLLGAKDNGTDKVPSVARGESGAEEDEAGFSLQRHRHLGGGEQQNRKLSGSTTAATKGGGSGEILSGAGGGERERALVESSAPAIAAKRRQVASREPTSGAEAKVAVEEEEAAERSLGGDQFGRGTKSTHLDNNNNNSDRNGVTQEEQSQSAETNRQPTRRSRQQQAIGNAKAAGRRTSAAANEWPKYELAEGEGGGDRVAASSGERVNVSTSLMDPDGQEEEEADPDVRSIMLTNDRLVGKLQRTLFESRRRRGGGALPSHAEDTWPRRKRLDYDLSLLGDLVSKTIVWPPEDYELQDAERKDNQEGEEDDEDEDENEDGMGSNRSSAPEGERALAGQSGVQGDERDNGDEQAAVVKIRRSYSETDMEDDLDERDEEQ